MAQTKFNVRVYGILFDENKRLLVSDELIRGTEVVKFPGGGLEFGEGTIECLKRECIEEGIGEVTILNHFYTTDFFQPSAFNPNHQILSIYYFISSKNVSALKVSSEKFHFERKAEDEQSLRWLKRNEIQESEFTLPIDKKVGQLLEVYLKTL